MHCIDDVLNTENISNPREFLIVFFEHSTAETNPDKMLPELFVDFI